MSEEIKTLPPESWNALAQRMHDRAMSGDAAAIRFCERHKPITILSSEAWPWAIADLDARCQAALKEQYGQFPFARAIADDLAKLPQHALFALHQGFHELEDRGVLHVNVSVETKEQLEAQCRVHDEQWADVCKHVGRLLAGVGTRTDLEKLAFAIASLGRWTQELVNQYYASIVFGGSTSGEHDAEVAARHERVLTRLKAIGDGDDAPAPEIDPAGLA